MQLEEALADATARRGRTARPTGRALEFAVGVQEASPPWCRTAPPASSTWSVPADPSSIGDHHRRGRADAERAEVVGYRDHGRGDCGAGGASPTPSATDAGAIRQSKIQCIASRAATRAMSPWSSATPARASTRAAVSDPLEPDNMLQVERTRHLPDQPADGRSRVWRRGDRELQMRKRREGA